MLELSLQVDRSSTSLHYALRLEAGQCMWLTGASGTGKSTLLEAIAGFVPCAGTLRWAGRDLHGQLPHQRPVTSQFQSGNLFDHLSVERNIQLALDAPIAPARIAQLLERLALPAQCLHALPSTLSGGMRQRVALARSLLRERPLTLLDEPFSALDAPNRDNAVELIHEQAYQGRVFLVAAHQLSEHIAWPQHALQ